MKSELAEELAHNPTPLAYVQGVEIGKIQDYPARRRKV